MYKIFWTDLLNLAGDEEFQENPNKLFTQVIVGSLDDLYQYDPIKDVWLKLDEDAGVTGKR